MEALTEAYRILKSGGKFILDIPDNAGKMRRFMRLVEETIGRPNQFNMSLQKLKKILINRFEVEKIEKIDAVAMVKYYLRRTV